MGSLLGVVDGASEKEMYCRFRSAIENVNVIIAALSQSLSPNNRLVVLRARTVIPWNLGRVFKA